MTMVTMTKKMVTMMTRTRTRTRIKSKTIKYSIMIQLEGGSK